MRYNQAHNLSVQTAFLTAAFIKTKKPDPKKYLVDLKTGERLNKARGGEIDAQEALLQWWTTLKIVQDKQRSKT